MLKIQRTANGEVVFTVSGRMDSENVDELKELFASEAKGRGIALDLKDLTLVDRDAAKRTASSSRIAQHTSESGSRENEAKVKRFDEAQPKSRRRTSSALGSIPSW
jgi:anti-anti-sigma regulatory factor